MNYYSAWTISSVAKMVTEALKKTGDAGVFVIVAAITGGGYLGYRKIHDLEKRVLDLECEMRNLEFQMKFGGK